MATSKSFVNSPSQINTLASTNSGRISLRYHFTRANVPLYSGNDATTNSLQGSTKNYVIADATYPGDVVDADDESPGRGRFWNHMYVKVSRVKRMERLLILNAPSNLREIMEAGPPADTVTEMRRPRGPLCALRSRLRT